MCQVTLEDLGYTMVYRDPVICLQKNSKFRLPYLGPHIRLDATTLEPTIRLFHYFHGEQVIGDTKNPREFIIESCKAFLNKGEVHIERLRVIEGGRVLSES